MNTEDDQTTTIENLPNELFIKIFSCLPKKDLCRAGRVSIRWYHLSKSSILWDYFDEDVAELKSFQVQQLVEILPPSVKRLRLRFRHPSDFWSGRFELPLPEFMASLRQRCPRLKALIIEDANLIKKSAYFRINYSSSDSEYPLQDDEVKITRRLQGYWNSSEPYEIEYFSDADMDSYSIKGVPEELNVLSLRNALFDPGHFFRDSDCHLSKISVLDVTSCICVSDSTVARFSSLSHLKELYLANCPLRNTAIPHVLKSAPNLQVLDLESTCLDRNIFAALMLYGQSLVKLYVGYTSLSDRCLMFENEACFPNLEILCITRTRVSATGVCKLLNACPLLKSITLCLSEDILKDLPESMREIIKFDYSYKVRHFCDHFRRNDRI